LQQIMRTVRIGARLTPVLGFAHGSNLQSWYSAIHTDRKFGFFSFSKYYRVSTALWVDGTLSPGRSVAMLSATQLQLGRGGCHESATGATGPGDPWAKRLGDYHRAG